MTGPKPSYKSRKHTKRSLEYLSKVKMIKKRAKTKGLNPKVPNEEAK